MSFFVKSALIFYIRAWDHLPVIRRNIFPLNESRVLEKCLTSCTCFLPVYIDHLIKTRINVINFIQVLTHSCFNRLINEVTLLVSIITGDFNTRFKKWWSQYITNSQRSITVTLTSTSGYL